jgi:adhesin HecA-like repeat protein
VSLASTSTINNSGTLSGVDAVALRAGGVLTNASGASISGSGTGVGVYISGGVGTVTNAGSITGAYHGMFITSGASVTNATSGFISGPHNGIVFKNQAGTISNSGTISGTGSGSTGIYLESNASANITNTSSGTISGSFGIFATAGGTVTNAGKISGSSYAIDFTSSGTNRLIVDPGAVFVGKVKANSSGTNTLELAGGSGTGSISGVGTSFISFQTLALDPGATWTLTGANTVTTVLDAGSLDLAGTLNNTAAVVFQGSSNQFLIDNAATFGSNVGTSSYTGPLLENFVSGDKIDLKGFSSGGASSSYNTSTGVLQLSSGSSHASLKFQNSSLGSGSFQLSSDGAGGTIVTLDSDGSPEPPALSIANTSLTVAAGGTVSLGVVATPVDSDDAVCLTISGVPSYESILAPAGDTVTHQAGASTWTISSTAGMSITGLTLSSSYTGPGQPMAALSVTASNTTSGETASSASQILNVTDPPALTSTSPPSPTVKAAPVAHLAALFDQFLAAGFHNEHSGAGQLASLSSWQHGQEDSALLAHPHHHA